MPFGYYNLPFCHPEDGVRDSAENLGELLLGDCIENSPYHFRMYNNESDLVPCRIDPLSPAQLALLRQHIDEMYQVNLILDNLSAIRYTHKDELALWWTGYPIGIWVQDVYYLFNHLKFKVLVHHYEETDVACVIGTGNAEVIPATAAAGGGPPGYMVVGFEVVPCSFEHDPEAAKSLKLYDEYPSKIHCEPTMVAMAMKENHPRLQRVSYKEYYTK